MLKTPSCPNDFLFLEKQNPLKVPHFKDKISGKWEGFLVGGNSVELGFSRFVFNYIKSRFVFLPLKGDQIASSFSCLSINRP